MDVNSIPINDVWIAATALSVGAPLLTFDAHFNHVHGLDLVLLSVEEPT